MYIHLKSEFLDKNAPTGKKTAKTDDPTSKDMLFEDITVDSMDIEVGETALGVHIETEMGYFSIDIPLDADLLERMLSVTIRKMNKFKSIIENLK